MIDLHCHSTYSDGSNSVEEILELANQLHLTQLAITDHNTLKGSLLAHQLSPDNTVVGVEVSVGYLNNIELHLLGYFLKETDFSNTSFILQRGEIDKNLATAEIVENLNDMGYAITLNELKQYGSGTINRVHICRALISHGYISSVKEGFKNLVGDHCPAYVPRIYIPIKEVCEAIHQDGGICVLAHPYNYKTITDIPKLLEDNIDLIDGIECFHPSASKENSEFLRQYALDHHKIITGGSDYHGINKPDISLNMMQVDDCYKLQ